MSQMLVDVDVDDVEKAVAFYVAALGLRVGRRLAGGMVELLGGAAPIYLLQNPAGSKPFAGAPADRDYGRHWTPVHLDFAVEDLEAAVAQARAAGAGQEGAISDHAWGRMALMSDPFGHGFCLLQWKGGGYDEVTERDERKAVAATPGPPSRNIEAKYRCSDLRAVEGRAVELGARLVGVFAQEDRFYGSGQRRLKLRLQGENAELIGYDRADAARPRASDYRIHRTSRGEAVTLAATLCHALGASGVVRKQRRLLLLEHTRIHLDEVENLGTFVELETVITDQTEAAAQSELEGLATALALRSDDIVPTAYVDLAAAAS